jgi:glycerate kinase
VTARRESARDHPLRVLAAPDKFRGTGTAREIAAAIARGAARAGAVCDECPLADGGEGILDALGGPNRTSLVTGPLGDPVTAPWRLSGGTAVIEMAAASGLALLPSVDDNDPIAASTTGTGELIANAIDAGARRIVVGVGGSATTDGGFGALRAMYPLPRLRGIELIVACDVRTTFIDAAEVFSPQKGASPSQVSLLQRRLERLAQMFRDEYGVDVRDLPRSGAAGGLAGGLAAIGATLVDGFALVADEVSLSERVHECDLVVTGEGFLDEQSFEGKVVGGVVELAADAGVPVLAVVGDVYDDADTRVETIALAARFGRERAFEHTLECVELAVSEWLSARRCDGAAG